MQRMSVWLWGAAAVAAAGILVGSASSAKAAEAQAASKHEARLPPGPIHDRHELMEGIGKHADRIGKALKAGTTEPIAAEADAIAAAAKKIPGLFPPGSTHENSRAKPEIWTKWDEFEKSANALGTTAEALAKAARGGGDVNAAAQQMFETCKSCHKSFRVPKDDK